MIGKTISHYEILEHLGRGGMRIALQSITTVCTASAGGDLG
jgi:hypothetical protein